MNGSCSRSFRSFKKFLYFNLDYGESMLRSALGRIVCRLDLGTGVSVILLCCGPFGLQSICSLTMKGVWETGRAHGLVLEPIISSSD